MKVHGNAALGPAGRLALVEAIEEGAASLTRFKERIDTSRSGDPAVLAMVVATGYGYVRKDGIQVIPVGRLGP